MNPDLIKAQLKVAQARAALLPAQKAVNEAVVELQALQASIQAAQIAKQVSDLQAELVAQSAS